uniref:ABC transmembrane type-2 domain-containing protein n=1 Tax=Strigamia maritima TaxID=126957 RepID=T1J7J5_STRMM
MDFHPENIDAPVLRKPKCRSISFVQQSFGRTMALVIKNFIQMRRNLMLLFFQFLLPALQIIAFCLAIGGDPHDVPVAIYNEDINFGPRFLQKIDNKTVQQIHVDSYESGVDLVVNGEAAAVMHIWTNFSEALMNRFIASGNVPESIVQASSIHLRQDTTNQQIIFFINKACLQALEDFSADLLINFKNYPKIITNLLEVSEPIYGTNSSKTYTTEFMASGLILAIIYITAVGLTSVSFVIDRKQGMHERSCVSGATSFEIMCGYFLTQVSVVVIQVGIVLVFAIEVFRMHSRGSILLVILVALAQGICGMTLGFLLSIIFNHEREAMMGSLSIFFPCFTMSGILWSTLGMSNFVQKVSQALPHTLAVESMRWIMLRGRGMSWSPVWLGLVSTIAWIFGFIILSAIVMRIKQP